MKKILKLGCIVCSVILLFCAIALYYISQPSYAKMRLQVMLEDAEMSDDSLKCDEYDDVACEFIVNNRVTIRSMKQMLEESTCERYDKKTDFGPSISPAYYLQSQYVGGGTSFEITIFRHIFLFHFPSEYYQPWREYVEGVMNGNPGNGFELNSI